MNTRILVRILAAIFQFCLAATLAFAGAQAGLAPSNTGQAGGQTSTLLPNGSLLLAGGQDATGHATGTILLRDASGSERQMQTAPS